MGGLLAFAGAICGAANSSAECTKGVSAWLQSPMCLWVSTVQGRPPGRGMSTQQRCMATSVIRTYVVSLSVRLLQQPCSRSTAKWPFEARQRTVSMGADAAVRTQAVIARKSTACLFAIVISGISTGLRRPLFMLHRVLSSFLPSMSSNTQPRAGQTHSPGDLLRGRRKGCRGKPFGAPDVRFPPLPANKCSQFWRLPKRFPLQGRCGVGLACGRMRFALQPREVWCAAI